MEPWKPGDRVRFFTKRGGVFLDRGRVGWPDGTVTFADHCEPDEDGLRNVCDVCQACGREHRGNDALCLNCRDEPAHGEAPWALVAWWRKHGAKHPNMRPKGDLLAALNKEQSAGKNT